jgi:hypothetical protein
MDIADVFVPDPELGITGAEPDRLLNERNGLFDRADLKLALAEGEVCVNAVAIGRQNGLVFGDGLKPPPQCDASVATTSTTASAMATAATAGGAVDNGFASATARAGRGRRTQLTLLDRAVPWVLDDGDRLS